MTIYLFTRDGDLVHKDTRVPPFLEPPPVVIWGKRIFIGPNLDPICFMQLTDRTTESAYIEVSAYVIARRK